MQPIRHIQNHGHKTEKEKRLTLKMQRFYIAGGPLPATIATGEYKQVSPVVV